MSEPARNLEEVTDKAIKTGEKVITMQCPCCGKIFMLLRVRLHISMTIRQAKIL